MGDSFVKQSDFRYKSVSQLFYYSYVDFQLYGTACSRIFESRIFFICMFEIIQMFAIRVITDFSHLSDLFKCYRLVTVEV